MVPEQASIWIDGQLADALPLPDRGLDFGDGLFETLLVVEGVPRLLELHLQRLQEGLQTLAFPDCLAEIKNQIDAVSSAAHFPTEAAMRVTVTRGGGARGYLPPAHPKPRVIITLSKLADKHHGEMSAPARLKIANIRWGCQPALAGIKHLNRLEQVLAAREREAAGVDEVLMLDQQGHVISVSAGNIFIRQGDCLLTPLLDNCGVRGTRRRLIMQALAPALGLQVREAEILESQLQSADEVFYCNALVGVRPVTSLAAHSWPRHDTAAAIHKMLSGPGQ